MCCFDIPNREDKALSYCLSSHLAVLFCQGCLTSWVCFQSFLGTPDAFNRVRACDSPVSYLPEVSCCYTVFTNLSAILAELFTSVQFHQPKLIAGHVLVLPSLHPLSPLRADASWLFSDLRNLKCLRQVIHLKLTQIVFLVEWGGVHLLIPQRKLEAPSLLY